MHIYCNLYLNESVRSKSILKFDSLEWTKLRLLYSVQLAIAVIRYTHIHPRIHIPYHFEKF